MAMTSTQWRNFLGSVVYNEVNKGYKEVPDPYSGIFNEESSELKDIADTEIITFGAFGEWSGEDVVMPTDVADQGSVWTYEQTLYALSFAVTYAMKTFEQFNIVRSLANALGKSARYTIALLKANVFNNAFSTALGDGEFLCDTDHPTYLTGEDSNTPASAVDLSVAGLTLGIKHFKGLTDSRGIPILMTPKNLLIGTDYLGVAEEILKSPNAPYTADNQVNWLKDQGINIVYTVYNTDSDAWFLLADKGQHKLKVFWKEKPNFRNYTDDRTLSEIYQGKFGMVAGASDWRGVYGSAGA